jgi:hypothetical protein
MVVVTELMAWPVNALALAQRESGDLTRRV